MGLATGNDLLARVSVGRRLADLKGEVGGPSPQPLEKLLAEEVALCWLGVHVAELDVTALRRHAQAAGPQVRAAQQQQLDRAHQRYVSAIRQLASLRRLPKPALSPLDLARRPVEETAGQTAALRARAGVAPDGVPVAN